MGSSGCEMGKETVMSDSRGEAIGYSIVRNTRSSRIRIAVYADGRVVVRCPPGIAPASIDSFVEENTEWIAKTLSRMKSEPTRIVTLRHGASIPLFGKDYTVVFDDEGPARGRIEGKNVRFNGKGIDSRAALGMLFRFYETELQAYLLDRIEDMERLTGLAASSYRVRAYKSKWGSCSPEGVVSFNLKLAAFQSEVVDYVIIHELCHLRHRNHSKAFWRLVGKYMEDVQERRARLRREAKKHEFV